jgi:hypothetical protein
MAIELPHEERNITSAGFAGGILETETQTTNRPEHDADASIAGATKNNIFKRMFDFFMLGADRPIRRLLTYYLVLAVIVGVLVYFFPAVDRVLGGVPLDDSASSSQVLTDGSRVLADGLQEDIRGFDTDLSPRVDLALSTLIILLGVLALMLPVSWVYMSTRYSQSHDQQVAQILIFLPLVVAGIVLVVQNSLALAFSLAGVVAAVRFRSTLRDARDLVFIFLAIAVGFAGGVQTLILAAIVSVLFNVLLILTWKYDFGRGVLEPTAASQWKAPLKELAKHGGNGNLRDRELVIALDQKQAVALAQRFHRVQKLIGPPGKKARYNAILIVTTEHLTEAQSAVGEALDQVARRWRLDEVVTNVGKPSELCYLVRIPKATSREDFLTVVRAHAADTISGADVQLSEATKSAAEAKL